MFDEAAVIVQLLKSYRLGIVLKIKSEIMRQWPTVTEFEATKFTCGSKDSVFWRECLYIVCV